MSPRDELAELLDRIYYDYEGGYLSNEENLEFVQADALIAEGWRKKPTEAEVISVLDDDMNWDVGELSPVLLMEQTARAILALMDRGQ